LGNGAVGWEASNIAGAAITDRNGGCAGGGAEAAKTLTATAKGSQAELKVSAPDGLNISRVRVVRKATGLGAAGSAAYKLTYGPRKNSANSPEIPPTTIADTLASTTQEFPVTGAGDLKFTLTCADTATCTGSLDVLSVAFLVSDDKAPYGLGVGRNNPVVTSRDKYTDPKTNVTDWWIKEQPMSLSARDEGVGLSHAVVKLAGPGIPGISEYQVPLGKCVDLSPGDAVNDRPLDRAACAAEAANTTTDAFKWRDAIPDTGTYVRSVVFYDAAGNSSAGLENDVFDVSIIGQPVSTRTLSIGTDPVTIQEGPGGGPKPPGGGVGGAQSTQCRTPRLSVVLSSKPLRITKGTPVLKYKKAYKFTGRLTCVINGKRRTAPKRTKVSILNKVGKKTVRKPNTAIRDKGAVNVKLAFVSSRTVIFRYTNAAGQKSEVKIKVRVSKSKK
jgi:hypothetical protein